MSADPDRLFSWGLRIALVVSVFCLALFPLTSVDVWLHLGVGQEIVQRGEIPTTGWGSRLFPEREWIAHEWLFQTNFYRVHDAYGATGLILLRALAAALTTVVLLWATRQAGAGPYAACAAAGLGMYVGFTQLFWPARPQIVTQLFLPIVLAILFRGREGRRRLLLLIPLILALWVNLHGGYIIGLGMVFVFLLAEVVGPAFGRESDPAWRRALLLTLGAGTLACLLNPYTFEALVYPFRYYLGDPITSGNEEWKRLVLGDLRLFEGLALATLVAVLVARPGRDLVHVLLGIGFLYMAVVSRRHAVLAALVLAIGLGASWTRLWGEGWGHGSVRAVVGRVRGSPSLRALATLAVLLVGFSATLLAPLGARYLWGDHRRLPVDEVDYIEKHDLVDGLFNQYEWGGYLIYRFPGRDPVFIDGRNDLYGSEHTEAYKAALRVDGGWAATRERLDGWGVKTVLLETGGKGRVSPLAEALRLDPHWDLRFLGPVGAVFVWVEDPEGPDEGDEGVEVEEKR